MKKMMNIALLATLLMACAPEPNPGGGENNTPTDPLEAQIKNTTLENYNYAPDAPRSNFFAVGVQGSGEMENCYVFPMVTNHDSPHIVTFGANGLVRVEIYPLTVVPETVVARPLAKEYPCWVEDGKVVLYVSEGDKATVEINGNEDMPVLVFVNPLETNKPSKDDPNVEYYEAGKVYDRQPTYSLSAGKTLYIEGGAIVKGGFKPTLQDNITVAGYGIIDDFHVAHENNSFWAFRMDRCNGAKISGVIIANMAGYSCATIMSHDITFDNVKIIAPWNEDHQTGVENGGIAFFACQKVRCKDLYAYAHDDTYMVKTNKWSWIGEAKDLVFEGCQANNVRGGNAFEIGYEVNEGVDGVVFRDCYVIHSARSYGYTYRHGSFTIHNSTKGTVKNILYENCYIDDPKEFDFYISVLPDCGYSLGNGVEWGPGHIENVTIRNVYVHKKAPYGEIMFGLDSEHTVKNVTIENFNIEGKKMTSFEEIGFGIDPKYNGKGYVKVNPEEVTFK